MIYSLDLGVLLPAYVISAYWLRKRQAWGYAFTAVLLVKIATLGPAVLAMIAFMLSEGIAVVVPQILIFSVLSLLGLGLLVRFVMSIGPVPTLSSSSLSGGMG